MPRITVALGVPPEQSEFFDTTVEQSMREAVANKHVRAIGSCGLSEPNSEYQLAVFKRQLDLALEFDLPIIVQAGVESEGDACDAGDAGGTAIILEILKRSGLPADRVMLRACAATADDLRAWAEWGSYVAFDAHAANDAVAACKVADLFPANRILLESGAPAVQAEKLAGYPARADQVVFAADALLGICPAAQLAANYATFFGVAPLRTP